MIALHQRPHPDRLVAIGEITAIEAPRGSGGNQTRLVRLRDGDAFSVPVYEAERICRHPVQLIPAAPGTALLNTFRETPERAIEAIHTPLIAWALCVDGEIRPVTACGVEDGQSMPRHGFAILLPSGQVSVGEHALFKDLASYLASDEARDD